MFDQSHGLFGNCPLDKVIPCTLLFRAVRFNSCYRAEYGSTNAKSRYNCIRVAPSENPQRPERMCNGFQLLCATTTVRTVSQNDTRCNNFLKKYWYSLRLADRRIAVTLHQHPLSQYNWRLSEQACNRHHTFAISALNPHVY
jgi:hypothetical protein